MNTEKLSPESLIPLIQLLLKRCLISLPVYGNMKRQLAECFFATGKSLEGVKHLVESLGGKHKFEHLKLESACRLKGGTLSKENIENIDTVKIFNSIPLEYPNTAGFLEDLHSLPVEWTLVQISRLPKQKDVLHNVLEFSSSELLKFSLGKLRLVVMRSGELPVQVLVDQPRGSSSENMDTYFDLLNKALKKDDWKYKGAREKSSNLIKELSKSLGECWLREYQCLPPGQLKSPRLNAAIEKTLAQICHSLVTMETSARAFLRLILNGAHLVSETQIYDLVQRHVTVRDDVLSQHVTTHVMRFKQVYDAQLSTAARYPVILLLEEELDTFPWETAVCLRGSPVTRVHCFQFLVALVRVHGSQRVDGKPRLRNGYLHVPRINHKKDTFVVLNPSSDFLALETHFKTFLRQKLGDWQGIIGRPPTAAEFQEGLAMYSLFIYCGHGNGTEYLSSEKLGKCRLRAIAMLFGCRSVERTYHGGRTPFSSIVQKYFVAGSPCIVGNLWNVTTTDCDRISSNLINLSFPSSSRVDLSSIFARWWNVPSPPALSSEDGDVSDPDVVTLHVPTTGASSVSSTAEQKTSSTTTHAHSPDLCANVQWARHGVNYFVNGASLVVWGLPVWFEE